LLAGSLLLFAVGLMVEGTSLGLWFTDRLDLNPAWVTAWSYLRWGVAMIFGVLAVQLLYHFDPDVKQRFRHSLTGAIVAVITWIGLSCLLGSYFRHFDNLDKTYGPLGAAIGLYLWFYLSGFAILAGGEINFLLGELRSHKTRSITLNWPAKQLLQLEFAPPRRGSSEEQRFGMILKEPLP
jgi:membrane protein